MSNKFQVGQRVKYERNVGSRAPQFFVDGTIVEIIKVIETTASWMVCLVKDVKHLSRHDDLDLVAVNAAELHSFVPTMSEFTAPVGMSSHELARRLLEQPDLPLAHYWEYDGSEGYNDIQFTVKELPVDAEGEYVTYEPRAVSKKLTLVVSV